MSKEAHAFSNTSAYTFISDAITAMSLYRYPFVLTNRLILSATYFASFPESALHAAIQTHSFRYILRLNTGIVPFPKTPSEQSRKRYTGLSNKHIGSSISVFFSPAILHKRCDHLFAERKNLIRMFIYIRIFSSVHRHCDHHFFAH